MRGFVLCDGKEAVFCKEIPAARREDTGMPDGPPTRFLALLDGCRDALSRFADRMLPRREDAQDAVQDAVLIAYRKFAGYEDGNFKGWIFAILSREILRRRRDLARGLERLDPDTRVEDLAAVDRWEGYADVRRDPERFLQEFDDAVRRAVLDLPEEQRMIFLLRVVENFSCREIATMLAMPVGTVASHVHRARARLRERLGTAAQNRRGA